MNIHKNFHVTIKVSPLKIMNQEIYSFSIAATIDYHKFSSFQQHKFLSFKVIWLLTNYRLPQDWKQGVSHVESYLRSSRGNLLSESFRLLAELIFFVSVGSSSCFPGAVGWDSRRLLHLLAHGLLPLHGQQTESLSYFISLWPLLLPQLSCPYLKTALCFFLWLDCVHQDNLPILGLVSLIIFVKFFSPSKGTYSWVP